MILHFCDNEINLPNARTQSLCLNFCCRTDFDSSIFVRIFLQLLNHRLRVKKLKDTFVRSFVLDTYIRYLFVDSLIIC